MRSNSKYGNKKAVGADGTVYDSKKELRRYAELCFLERAGEIFNIRRQVPYEIVPEQRDPRTGKIVERKVEYVADFVYQTKDGKTVVEDVKTRATRTQAYIIKRKLMLYVWGIKVVEV